jgi:hypothetical protein
LRFPASKARIENSLRALPGLHGCHILDRTGHWIQRERAPAASELLVGFLADL